MTPLQALLLGLVQGLFEWLPVSSEGLNSLILINFFNTNLTQAVYLSIWLHLGTMLAAIVYFRKTILKLFRNISRYKNQQHPQTKLALFLLITTLISGALGAFLILTGLEKLNLSYHYAMLFIGLALIITAFLQFRAKKKQTQLSLKKPLKVKHSLAVGIAQGFSALPGISRSGITTATLLFQKYSAPQALKLSFLLSIPLVLGANIGLSLFHKLTFDLTSLLAILVSFFTGLLSIHLLLKLARKINFGWFCLFLGILSIIAILF